MRLLHMQDIRYAFRLLGRSPGFAALAVLVLAGGLGVSTFTFSFLYTAMIRPLPLSEGERIVRVDPVVQGNTRSFDAVDLAPLRASVRTVRELGAYKGREIVMGREGDRRVVGATVADPALFTVARTPAFLGRTLVPADAEPGAEPVVVLSYRTWELAFGGDSALLDRQVTLDGRSTRVVGIMPKRYGFPVATEAWLPLPATTMRATAPGLESVRLAGRLEPGVSHDEAAAELTVLLQRALASRASSGPTERVEVAVQSFPAAQIGEQRALVFTTLNVLAALILLLALVNVTNLLLARANERVRETAVRMALGASRGRLVMQGMWETIILCTLGGILGTAGAAWGLSAITGWTRANMEENLAFWWMWQMDGVTLLCAGAFVTVAMATLGSVVSLRTTRMNVREVLQDTGARAGSRTGGRFSRLLVATQVTTVTVLMFFGAISGIVAHRVVTIDPGFSISKLLTGGVMPPAARYSTPAASAALLRDVHARLAEEQAFDGVLLRSTLADEGSESARFALRDARVMNVAPTAHIRAVLGDLATTGITMTEGRAVDASDDATRAPVVMISRSLANRFWKGRSPVGEELRLTGVGDTTQFRTIVGVASDVPYGNPFDPDPSTDAVYLPLLQAAGEHAVFVVRYRTTEVAARQALMQAFGAVDPLLVPDSVQPLEETLRKMGLIATSVSKLFAACFGFALILALVGTYGLMSRAIGARTREIGVRRALGASDAVVARLLLWQGGRQLGVGTLVAAPMLLVMGLMARHYFPIGAWLTATVGVVVSVSIVALVLAATWMPTRKVLRIELSDALRSE